MKPVTAKEAKAINKKYAKHFKFLSKLKGLYDFPLSTPTTQRSAILHIETIVNKLSKVSCVCCLEYTEKPSHRFIEMYYMGMIVFKGEVKQVATLPNGNYLVAIKVITKPNMSMYEHQVRKTSVGTMQKRFLVWNGFRLDYTTYKKVKP